LSDTTEPNTEIKYIEVSDVSQELGVKYFESMYFSDAPSRARRIVSEGDVIVSTVRTYLKAIAHIGPEHNKFICSTGFCVVRPISISPQFAKYALASDFFMSEVISRSSGVSYPAINAADLVRVKIAVPPLLEQQAISHYLFTEISALDLAINSQIKLIELLNERRSAIITQAVTGQIDVR
jgi:type I restriction enzyme S subunit